MKILLVGEYSRLHNSLKEGLLALGHEVILIGSGDYFKKYPVDINIDGSFVKNHILLNKIRHLLFFLTKIDLAAIETFLRFRKHTNQLATYDCIQLINETPFNIGYYFERKLLKLIFECHKNVFLLACGDDYKSIHYYLKNELKYSVLTPYIKNPQLFPAFKNTLRYIRPPFIKTHHFVYAHIRAVIPSDFDYVFPLANEPLATPFIPNPVNIDRIEYQPNPIREKIIIFHGINTASSLKKGNSYFTEALKIIKEKYPEKIEIITTHSLPYQEYIKNYKRAHILLDQVFSYDQGYNALEAMAAGKVVFTGIEEEVISFYNLKEKIGFNSVPDSSAIAKDLEFLILHPTEIVKIGKNARNFIETHHSYIQSAQKYMDTWSENSVIPNKL